MTFSNSQRLFFLTRCNNFIFIGITSSKPNLTTKFNIKIFEINNQKREIVGFIAINEVRRMKRNDMGFHRDLREEMQHEEQVN